MGWLMLLSLEFFGWFGFVARLVCVWIWFVVDGGVGCVVSLLVLACCVSTCVIVVCLLLCCFGWLGALCAAFSSGVCDLWV